MLKSMVLSSVAALALAVVCVRTASGGAPPIVWNGGAGNWTVGANWVGGVVPTAGSNVLIDNGNAAASNVAFNTAVSLASLTLDAGDTLAFSGANRVLTMTGSILNNGQITLQDPGAGVHELRISGVISLNGSGSLLLNSANDNRILPAVDAAIDTLLVGPDQLITTSGLTDLNSFITVRLENDGLVEANTGGLLIATNPMVNRNLLRAINGGQLRLETITVGNAAGEIEAATGSVVSYDNATIIGGVISGQGSHAVLGAATATYDGAATPVTIESNATVELVGSSNRNLHLLGSIVNDGLIVLEQGTSGGISNLQIDGVVSLTGSGSVRLQGTDDNLIVPFANAATDVLSIGAAQTITTDAATDASSQITVRFDNAGLIEANGGRLDLRTNPKSNTGLIRSIAGGNLLLSSVSVQNAGGEIEASPGSVVTYDNGTVSGGTIAGGGSHAVAGGATATYDGTGSPVSIETGTTVELVGSSNRNLRLLGAIINDGLIVLQQGTSGGISSMQIQGAVSLTGSGVVRLQAGDDNSIVHTVNAAADVLTIGPDQSITTDAATDFSSRIGVLVNNLGVIEANGGQLNLDTNEPKVNSGVLRSANGGNLRFDNIDVSNTNGEILVGAASTLTLLSSVVTGGELQGSGAVASSGATTAFNAVTISPGENGPGVLTLNGTTPAMSGGGWNLDLGGFGVGTDHDAVVFQATPRFSGTLRVQSINGFVPSVGDRFQIATYPHTPNVSQRFSDFESVGFPGFLTVRVDYLPTVAELVVVRIGDINCDGNITVSDIAPMVIALTEPQNFATLFPNCEIFDADINGDGIISVSDIAPFIALLTGG